jgi:phosphoribosylformylglycinamidine synthase
MQPFEIMVAETQERMLAVVTPEDFSAVQLICEKWGVTCTKVGQITDTGRFVVRNSDLPFGEDIVADMPAEMLANSAPEYDPKSVRPTYLDEVQNIDLAAVLAEKGLSGGKLNEDLLTLLSSSNICSRQWIWEQCDSEVQGNTVIPPGADAAVIRIGGEESWRGIAVATDCNGRYCYLDPYRGAQLALTESMRNLACVGAKPAAITDCLNFGNPEKPEVFYTFEQAVRGLADACEFYKIPVVSGNVSFYNESFGSAIYPTPAVGIVGLLDDVRQTATADFKNEGDVIVLVGETFDELGASEYLKVVCGQVAGRAPELDLELEGAVQDAVCSAVRAGLVASAHDCSEGGLAVALAECCVSGEIGANVVLDNEISAVAALFSESASRILVSVHPKMAEELLDLLESFDVPFSVIGQVGGDVLAIDTAASGEQTNVIETPLALLTSTYLDALEMLVSQ